MQAGAASKSNTGVDITFGHSNVSEANEIKGNQLGSHRLQTTGPGGRFGTASAPRSGPESQVAAPDSWLPGPAAASAAAPGQGSCLVVS